MFCFLFLFYSAVQVSCAPFDVTVSPPPSPLEESSVDDQPLVILEERIFAQNFEPCANKPNFCTELCPTYCDRYFGEERRYDYCNCTRCYCRCSIGQPGPRDSNGNLQCAALDLTSDSWQGEGVTNGDDFLTKVFNISGTTTATPSIQSQQIKFANRPQLLHAPQPAAIIPIVVPHL
ncbi:hypothetical protein M3Y98_00036900 [Aphelenchoides besseyi]|nr:hypothetical protein M3Y98_00036900 [Aphelenchoides besseyi]KAI6199078.1 hypothetical protein M3Y96_00588400 [Aphelenchoides besseyi]